MATTSKEERAKIHALKREISQTKSYYFNKINPLRQREIRLRHRPASLGPIASKIAAKKEEEWERVKNELGVLEKERDKKLKALNEELVSLKKNYRENYEKYKKEDKEVVDNKIQDVKFFIKHHRIAVTGIAGAAFLILIAIVALIKDSYGVACPNDFVGLTVNEAVALADKLGLKSDVWGETYDPEARDEQTVEFVSSIYYPDGSMKYGYNKYTNADMRLKSGYRVSFEVTSITAKQQKEIDSCRSNGDNYRYKFEDGKVTCYAEATQEEKQAACEAEGKWYRDGVCRSQEDWELHYKWQDAHSICKKYGAEAYAKTLTDCYLGNTYMGPVNDRDSNDDAKDTEVKTEEPAETQPEPSSSSQSSGSDPYQIPEDEVYTAMSVCKSTLERTYGIKIRGSEYSDGYTSGREYEWTIVFRNGRGYNVATCSYNWKTGGSVAMYLN